MINQTVELIGFKVNYSQIFENASHIRPSYTFMYKAEYDVWEILNDICRQFDDKFILMIFFIFTFYATVNYILPVVRNFVKRD